MFSELNYDPKSISFQLYCDLLSGIQAGDFPPRSPMPTEAALAHSYGVSRAIVRSALSILKEKGIIVSKQGSGTIVAYTNLEKEHFAQSLESREDIKKCYQCREAIEPAIAALAAANRTQRHVRFLQKQLRVFEKEQEAAFIDTSNDTEFHVRLSAMCGNSYFESIMNSLRPRLLIGMNITKTLSVRDRKAHEQCSINEHFRIANAVIEGDQQTAEHAMLNHLIGCQIRVFH